MRHHYRASYKERIIISELRQAPAGVVVEWLRTNWKEPHISSSGESLRADDKERDLLEYVLVRRGDGDINFALARYGYNLRAIQTAVNNGGAGALYAGANNPRGGTRLAQRTRIVTHGKSALLEALLHNKFLPGGFIEALLLRKGEYAGIDDDRFINIVVAITGTPRLSRPYDEAYLDGYAEYSYHKPFDAAWSLANTVPANQGWASVLWNLFLKTRPATSLDNVTKALERWRIDEPIEPPIRWYKRSPSFFVRSLIADRLQADDALLKAEDAALRTSFYRRFRPESYKKWPSFFQTDGDEFIENVLQNMAVWQSSQHREQLRALAWEAGKTDSSLDQVNSFRAKMKRLQEEHPSWFPENEQ